MTSTKTTSIIGLIFDKKFKNWIEKGKPTDSEFSNLTADTLQDASEIIEILESRKAAFSKQEIDHKFSDVMSRIKDV